MSEEKSYKIIESKSEELDKSFQEAESKMEMLKPNFEKIYDEVEKLEPQVKLFFLDRMLMELLLNSNLPVFYLNGLMKKADEFVKKLDGGGLKEEIKYRTAYVE